MAIVYIDIYGKCTIPVGNCSEVILCMTSVWADRTLTGLAIANGRIVATNQAYLNRTPSAAYSPCCTTPTPPAGCITYTPPTTNTCCTPVTNPCATTTVQTSNPCCAPTCQNGYLVCVYQVEIDTEQFIVDPLTETNYVPICSDFLDIMPYPCIINQLINWDFVVEDTSTVDLTYTGAPDHILSADVIISEDEGNIIIDSNGIYATETPNTATDTSTVDITLSGTFNRNIQADVIISSDPGNDLIDSNGLYVSVLGAETPNTRTDTDSVTITLSGTLDRNIQADVNIDAVTADNSVVITPGEGLYVPASYADVEAVAGTGDAAGLDITNPGTYVIGQTGLMTITNPSPTRSLAISLVSNVDVQCVLQTGGIWDLTNELNVDGGGWVAYSNVRYGPYGAAVTVPLIITDSQVDTLAPGATVTFQRRVVITNANASAASSTAHVWSIDLRGIWVTK